jgi:hypothetical protein
VKKKKKTLLGQTDHVLLLLLAHYPSPPCITAHHLPATDTANHDREREREQKKEGSAYSAPAAGWGLGRGGK